jgi:acetylornithine deacetylase/succinyl-diaminopimelate desuccinylase-like protein
LDINGLWSGWSGPGPKTIIPAKAGAKLSSRLVGNQDPEKIYQLIKRHIESITPPTVKVKVSLVTTGKPACSHPQSGDGSSLARVRKRMGARPIFTRRRQYSIVAEIADFMHIPVVMMG